MEPHEAAGQLEQLMAHRDSLVPPASAARDSAEFRAFLGAEQKVGDFIAEHQAELEALRLPREGMTVEKYQATLGRLDRTLAWQQPRAARGGPAARAYDAAGRTGWPSRRTTSQTPGPGHPGQNPNPSRNLRRSHR